MIRSVKISDAESVSNIYNYYVSNSIATFEEEAVSPKEMESRFDKNASDNLPWLVAEDGMGEVIAYAYAGKWSGRCAYKHSVEISVYLSHTVTSQGWGTRLYEALFTSLKELPIHVVIGGIALPNATSVALHEKFGMQKVAHFNEVGFKFGKWIDVGYWQATIKA
ncbi:MAG: N-acetyltransferase [Proteobacteria bacterium]|nr:N-acetyltransferase [Pseudomonadota bacterium]